MLYTFVLITLFFILETWEWTPVEYTNQSEELGSMKLVGHTMTSILQENGLCSVLIFGGQDQNDTRLNTTKTISFELTEQ